MACALHAWNVLEKDALPLILTYHTADHEALSLDAIKLLVFLTLPPDGDAANVIDQKRKARDALEAMFRFRDVRGDVFAVLFSRLAGPLERHEDSALRAREEDGKLVQLFVTLVRNLLLASQSPAGETRGEANAAAGARRLRASTVKMLGELRVTRCLAQMARDARKKPFSEDAALLVETFHLLFASQSPSRLVKTLATRDDETAKKPEGDDERSNERSSPRSKSRDEGDDPAADCFEDPPVAAPKNTRRTFVDACRVKSTQMRHGRFGGATSRLLAKAATESKKRKSFIGSELGDAPGGYFGERPTGGPNRRGAKARGASGAIMTADTVGAFKARHDDISVVEMDDRDRADDESDPVVREALAEFALDLSFGGFNEIALAAWNQLRHAEQHATGTEEHAARVHGFLGLAHFFVVFSRLRLANAAGRRAPNDRREKDDHREKDEAEKDDASFRVDDLAASASNLFDKHVTHWLRMTWDFFEETKDRRGLVLVSGLTNEMLGFLSAVMDHGSPSDVFACEALIAETCGDRGGAGDESLPRFLASRMKRYETHDAPLVFLANVAEAMHASGDLARRADPSDRLSRPKTYFDAKTVENHVRLAAHWRLNKPRLNAFVARFFAEAVDAEMELACHTFASLQTLHAVATETADETRRDLKMLRRISAKLVADFVGGLYQQEREDGTAPKIPRAKYVDLVF